MVQIVLRMPRSPGEWTLVELQGQLETRDQVSFDNMHIGDLHFDPRGTPHLILGHHLLTGKVVELDKPYAVLKKRSHCESRVYSVGMEAERDKASMECEQTRVKSEHSLASMEREQIGLELEHNLASMECEQNETSTLHDDIRTNTGTAYEVLALITRKIVFKNRPKPIITKTLPKKV